MQMLDITCKLSVIIPCYNTEMYMEDCLKSVLAATEGKGISAEILIVDDFSEDGSIKIAEKMAASSAAIRILHAERETRGPGHARNVAINVAKGEYIAFVDSDDLVVPDIYERMIASLEYHHSDICVCDVSRLKGNKQQFSLPHNRAFSHITMPVTTLKDSPSLVFGVMCWNTVCRRSFLNDWEIRYSEDMLYEDFLYCFQLMEKAHSISFVRNVEYLWRIRDERNLSITQRYNDLQNLLDRTKGNRQILDYVRQTGVAPEILAALFDKILCVFPATMLSGASSMSDEELSERVRIMREFAQEYIPEAAYGNLPIVWNQIWNEILTGDLSALRKCNLYRLNGFYSVPIYRINGHYELRPNTSIITIDRRDVQHDYAYSIPVCHIRSAVACGQALQLTGWLYNKRISMPKSEDQKVQAYLYNDVTGERKSLPTEFVPAEELTAEEGPVLNYDDYTNYTYDYRGCGFSITLNPEKLLENPPGEYLVLLEYENPLIQGERILRGMHRNAVSKLKGLHLENSTKTLDLSVDPRTTLQLTIKEKTKMKRLLEERDALKERVSELETVCEDLSRRLKDRSNEIEVEKTVAKPRALRVSRTFRIGKAIRRLPRIIRNVFR